MAQVIRKKEKREKMAEEYKEAVSEENKIKKYKHDHRLN